MNFLNKTTVDSRFSSHFPILSSSCLFRNGMNMNSLKQISFCQYKDRIHDDKLIELYAQKSVTQ